MMNFGQYLMTNIFGIIFMHFVKINSGHDKELLKHVDCSSLDQSSQGVFQQLSTNIYILPPMLRIITGWCKCGNNESEKTHKNIQHLRISNFGIVNKYK